MVFENLKLDFIGKVKIFSVKSRLNEVLTQSLKSQEIIDFVQLVTNTRFEINTDFNRTFRWF